MGSGLRALSSVIPVRNLGACDIFHKLPPGVFGRVLGGGRLWEKPKVSRTDDYTASHVFSDSYVVTSVLHDRLNVDKLPPVPGEKFVMYPVSRALVAK